MEKEEAKYQNRLTKEMDNMPNIKTEIRYTKNM